MRPGIRHEDGFSLVEVLLASVLFLVIISATTMVMTSFERLNRDTQRNDDQVERTRRAIERGSKQLRNLASKQTGGGATISVATADNIVFQTSDPTRTWVRFCTEPLAGGKLRLWSLSSPAATAPTATGCPGVATDWPKRDPVAENVTNQTLGRSEPLFTYGRTCLTGAPASCATATTSITSVSMQVLIDDDASKAPAEVRVSSGVFLRNQNESPTAKFVVRPGAMPRTVLLNASESTDPEGRTLRYFWFRTDNYTAFNCATGPTQSQLLGFGVTLNHKFLAADGAAGTTKSITLVVCDPGDLQATQTSDVTIPT